MATSPPVTGGSTVPHVPNSPSLTSRSTASSASLNRIERFEKHLTGKKLSLFKAAAGWSSENSVPDALQDMADVKIADASSAADRWKNAMEGEAQMTLPAMTTILKDFFQEAKDQRCENLLLVGESGQIILRPKNGNFKLYNSPDLPTRLAAIEIHPAIDEQLTLSVLKGLYGDSAVANLLQERNPESENPADPGASSQVDGNGNEASGFYSVNLARIPTSDTSGSDLDELAADLDDVSLPEGFAENLLMPRVRISEAEPSSKPVGVASDEVDAVPQTMLQCDQLPVSEPGAELGVTAETEVESALGPASASELDPAPELGPAPDSEPEPAPALESTPYIEVAAMPPANILAEPTPATTVDNAVQQAPGTSEPQPLAAILDAMSVFKKDANAGRGTDAGTISDLSDSFNTLDRVYALASALNILEVVDVDTDMQRGSMKNDLREMIQDFIPALGRSDHPWPSETKEACIAMLTDIKRHIDRELGSPIIASDMAVERTGPRGTHSPVSWKNMLVSTARQAGLQDIDDGPRFTEAQTARRYRLRPAPTIDARDLDLEIELFNRAFTKLRTRQDAIQPILNQISDSFSPTKRGRVRGLVTVSPYVTQYMKINMFDINNLMKDSHDEVDKFLQKWDKPTGRDKLVVNVNQALAREQIDAVVAKQKRLGRIFGEIRIMANERSRVTGEDVAHMTFPKMYQEPTMAPVNRTTDHLPGRA